MSLLEVLGMGKRGCFDAQEFSRFLSAGVVSASIHAL